MKKKMTIWISLLLAVSLTFGCGRGNNQETTDGNNFNIEKTLPERQTDETNASSDKKAGEKETGGTTKLKAPEMRGEVTISSFSENEFLNAVANNFMKKYSDVKIVINEYAKNIAHPSEKDYQTMFNTKLMSGEAEDIIFNSFLPITKYSDMGAFEDLTPYIEGTPEMNTENYYMNVLQSARNKNGKLYIIPYMARMDIMEFNADLVNENPEVKNDLENKGTVGFADAVAFNKKMVDEIKNPSKKDWENVYLSAESEISFATRLIKDDSDKFLDMQGKTSHFNTSEYTDLLEYVKNLKTEGYFAPDDIDYYSTKVYIAGMVDYELQAALFDTCRKGNGTYSYPLADRKNNINLNPNSCLMINSGSEHKELAWEFVKYLLSEESQGLPSMWGLPVNKKSFNKVTERIYKNRKKAFPEAGELKEYQNSLDRWMEQVNSCDVMDQALISLVEEENEKYFNGEQSAEETGKLIQRKMEQYFNE